MRVIFLVLSGLAAGCSDDGARLENPDAGRESSDVSDASDAGDAAPESLMLVDHEQWTPVASGADPFDDAPDQIDCDPQAFGTEQIAPEWTFFVKTQGCDYLTVSQPILGPIEAGQTLYIRLWHFDLTAPAASEAHLALRLGEHLVWEAYVPIPSDSQLLMDTWTSPSSIVAGEEIYFHVHNHGDNEYNLIEVSLSR